MATESGTVSEKTERLLLAQLSAPTVEAAAEQVGVSLSTAYRCRRQPRFRRRLERLRRGVFDQGLTTVQGLVGEAVSAVRRNLTCGVPAVEVSAAARVVDIGFKFADLADLSKRMEEIEQRLGDGQEVLR
jgi:hypothetical protein